jgi:hypothetical protein
MPDLLIAGAQKSGTTALYAWLGEHPEVFMSRPKEVHYFDQHYEEGAQWYQQHFKDAGSSQMAGEATPSYFYFEEAARRMARDVPAAKLIVLLRDPVNRAYSHYHHSLSRNEECLPFHEALMAEPERLSQGDLVARARYSYVDRGRYASQVRRLLSLYPRQSIHFDLFENLRDSPSQTYQRAVDFLGLDPAFVPPSLGMKANRYLGRRLRRVRRMLPKRLPLKGQIGKLQRVPVRGYPAMDPAARDYLVELFADERDELASLIGCDLGAWQS